MTLSRLKNVCTVLALVGAAACSDSSGPGSVSFEDALRSLGRGFGAGSPLALPLTMTGAGLGSPAGIGQATVTLDGKQETMYALGLRVTYPPGTCFESLLAHSPSTGFFSGCTPPPLRLLLALWQTSSGSRPPDRMILVSADVGTSAFGTSFGSTDGTFVLPAFAFYIDNGRREFWTSVAGNLTSQVTVTDQTCAVPPPPFAQSSSCNVAMFDEAGRITFEEFDLDSFDTPGLVVGRRRIEVEIPRQTIPGIVQAITEIRRISFPD